jgi:hypothetical protein
MEATMPATDVAPAADPDFLDQAIANAAWGLDTGLTWLIDKAVTITVAVGSFVGHHWMILTASAAVLVFHRKFRDWLTVSLVVGSHTVKTRIAQERAAREAHNLQVKQAHEDEWLADATDQEFQGRIEGLRAQVKESESRRKVLTEQMFKTGRHRAATLDRAAGKVADEINTLRKDIAGLERRRGHVRVIGLVARLMNGTDAEAKDALAELNRIWRKVDWQSLVPYDTLNTTDQKRVIQLLETMASNAQLGEARNAFNFVEKLLNSYNLSWDQAA